MVTIIPPITKDFVRSIEDKASTGSYRVNVNGIPIDVFPYIFPPTSPFSESTHTVYDHFGDLTGSKVLDIGTGTGIQAIQASLAGACEVDAVDIYDNAVECAKHNVRLNGLSEKIKVWQSDLFNNIPKKEYDLIIANLPIVEADENDLRLHSLFDPKFVYHERLFQDSSKYLSNSGRITLCHANLQNDGFERLEEIAQKNGFNAKVKKAINSLGYEWRNYDFVRTKCHEDKK
jgi:release factor glutamine methyltransferase